MKAWVALALTVALGILSRKVLLGFSLWDQHLGDALYAVAVYLVVILVTRHRAFPHAFAISLLICVGIEFFKLTGIPLALRRFLLVRWVLGTTFSLHNLALYLAGTTFICGIDYFFNLGRLPRKARSRDRSSRARR